MHPGQITLQQLETFYARHDPSKVAKAHKILHQYSSSELVAGLSKIYGQSPLQAIGSTDTDGHVLAGQYCGTAKVTVPVMGTFEARTAMRFESQSFDVQVKGDMHIAKCFSNPLEYGPAKSSAVPSKAGMKTCLEQEITGAYAGIDLRFVATGADTASIEIKGTGLIGKIGGGLTVELTRDCASLFNGISRDLWLDGLQQA